METVRISYVLKRRSWITGTVYNKFQK